jgi:hypothetical protein
MLSRRSFLRSSAASAASLGSGISAARAANAPGVTDTEIKIGQTMPYSGPASSVMGMIGRAEAPYFKMINEMGGVNGRKINLISLDDGYNPSKTVEQVRRLVEQDQVAFIFSSTGTSPNLAVQPYLNDNKVPQLFVTSGASSFGDPRRFPWTIGCYPSFQTEGHIYAKHILAMKPDARIGVLYQNDLVGKEYLSGFRDGLGVDRAAMIVKEVSYEIGDPTVDSQITALQAAGPDTIFLATIAKFGGQAIRKIHDLGWSPTTLCLFLRKHDRRGTEASRPREIQGPDQRRFFQGRDGPALEGPRGRESLRGIHCQIHESECLRGPGRPGLFDWSVAHRHAQALWRRSVARQHHAASDEHQGSRTAAAVAGHQGQNLARQLFSHPANATRAI